MYSPALEGMPLDKRRKYYDERVRWVTNYAYKNAPFMKKKMDEAGVDPKEVNISISGGKKYGKECI